jgi:hypothetical protein
VHNIRLLVQKLLQVRFWNPFRLSEFDRLLRFGKLEIVAGLQREDCFKELDQHLMAGVHLPLNLPRISFSEGE